MATRQGRIVLAVLAVVTAASLWRSATLQRDKRRLSGAYHEAQQLVEQLGQERNHLNSQLTDAHQTIETQTGELANLKHELDDVQGRLQQTMTEMASLQNEREQLRRHTASLETQLSAVAAEKAELEARLSNLKALKVAIREVKRKIWEQRLASWRARIESLRREERDQLASGNRGYLIRDGKSTMAPAPRMQVHVLEPQAQ